MKLNAAVKTGLVELELHKLYPYPNNFFVPYYGKRLNDLAESVENNGIITPIAVRLKDEEHFVILSGHNRVLAANMTNLKKIPAVVFVNLTDEEAEMIVIESNLHQRSFADLSLFERTEMVYKYHNQLKKQGRKSDLLNEIDIQKQLGNTSRRICRRLSPAEKSGYKFQLCIGYNKVDKK
jgi:ParB family chromosome partitioning protein